MHADNAAAAEGFVAERLGGFEHIQNVLLCGRQCGEGEGGRAAAEMEFCDFLKRLGSGFHGITAHGAVDVQVNEARGKKVAV